jgi:hypothetical protein
MRTQTVDQHRALAHQQFARAMQNEQALPLDSLHRNEAHVRPRHRLADRFGISRVVLAALRITGNPASASGCRISK